MGDEDRLYKQLFQELFGDLLSLMVPKLAPRLKPEEAEFLRGELFADAPETKRREVDLLAKVPTNQGGEELVLVHVEVEGRARSSMGRRLWHYAMLIRSRHELPLIPMVVYLRGGPPGVQKKTHRERVLGEEMVRFHYFSFGLSGSVAEEHLERPEALAWSLSSLMKAQKLTRPQHLLEVFRRIHQADLSWKQKHLLAKCVEYNLELDTEERKELDDMLAQQENEDVRSFKNHWINRLERDAEQRGQQEGLQKGLQKGMQKGLQKGLQKGMQQMLLGLLKQRFGSVPEATRRHVKSLDSAQELTRLAGRVSEASSLDELGLNG